MSDNYYKFTTHWKIAAPVNDVWYLIYESLEWPQWWKGVQQVKLIKKINETGINGIREYTLKSFLPYTLSFKMQLTEKQDVKFLKGIAFGELEGDGTWYFEEGNGTTKFNTTGM